MGVLGGDKKLERDVFNDGSLCSLSLLPPSSPWDAEFAGAFEFNEGEFILPKLFFVLAFEV